MNAFFRRSHKIGSIKLDVPPFFDLPDIQKQHRMYDRFLPVLVRHLNKKSLIVDIGANIGDSVAAMFQNCENSILAIEASNKFFSILTRNLARFDRGEHKRVRAIQKMVGSGKINGRLNHRIKGTATLTVTANETNTHEPLDQILPKEFDICLIKVDTDGFDFDVLNSGTGVLEKSQPVLFWENDISEEFQLLGYEQLYRTLSKLGYKYFFVFDNYGNLITQCSDFSSLMDFNQYTYSMRKHSATRTIYYTDVLATTEKNLGLCTRAIDEYRKNVIWQNHSSSSL